MNDILECISITSCYNLSPTAHKARRSVPHQPEVLGGSDWLKGEVFWRETVLMEIYSFLSYTILLYYICMIISTDDITPADGEGDPASDQEGDHKSPTAISVVDKQSKLLKPLKTAFKRVERSITQKREVCST